MNTKGGSPNATLVVVLVVVVVVISSLKMPNADAVITIAIRLRSDYDVSRAPVSIRHDLTRAKNEHVNVVVIS